MIPQLIMLGLAVVALCRAAAKDGEPDGKVSFACTLLGVAIQLSILYWGGFFDVLSK